MIHLPTRFAYIPPAVPGNDGSADELVRYEEAATLWLWASPRLLGWPKKVNWLFSPVVGNRTYPGDLWGLDSSGNLIAVETKIDKGRATSDPFEDFVGYGSSERAEWSCSASSLRQRWERLLESEKRFATRQLPELNEEVPLTGLHRGVVPYSRHRQVVWRWQELYRTRVAPQILSGAYERSVERSLRRREDMRDPPAIFFGLIATVRDGDPVLSKRGKTTLDQLAAEVGSERVGLRAIRVSRGTKKLRLRSWTPPAKRSGGRFLRRG